MDDDVDDDDGHFVFPDLPEHTTTRGASGSKQPCVVVFMYGISKNYILKYIRIYYKYVVASSTL